MRIPHRAVLSCCVGAALTLSVTSCNVFDPFDSPSGDPQLISAARAALDRGDYATALEAYQKLSADNSDIAASEAAYTILAQNGAGFGAFAAAFGSSPNGKGLTALANTLVSGAGEAKRLAIHGAYMKYKDISAGNDSLKQLVRFLGAASLAGEILAELAGPDGKLTAADFVATPSGCTSTTLCATTQTTECGAGTTAFSTSATNGDIATQTPSGAAPTMDQLYNAINEATTALSGLGSSSQGSFNGLLGGQSALPSSSPFIPPCFRAGLLSQGIGS